MRSPDSRHMSTYLFYSGPFVLSDEGDDIQETQTLVDRAGSRLEEAALCLCRDLPSHWLGSLCLDHICQTPEHMHMDAFRCWLLLLSQIAHYFSLLTSPRSDLSYRAAKVFFFLFFFFCIEMDLWLFVFRA